MTYHTIIWHKAHFVVAQVSPDGITHYTKHKQWNKAMDDLHLLLK